MTVELRTPTDDDLPTMVAVDARNFAHLSTPADVEQARQRLDLDRFVIAVDRGDIVAVGGSYGLELTLPGGGTAPLSGVTWVSVLASHTRQGILRRLMAWLDDRAAAGEEPVLGLLASEGAIYERFGYGTATRNRVVEIDRRRTQLRPAWQPEPGSVRLVEARDHLDEMMERFERYRRTQVGEVSRFEAYIETLFLRDEKSAVFAALHDDGYALWTTTPHWHTGHPAHELHVNDFVAVTAQAHAALWHTILSIDLVGPINSHNAVAHDDPLPYLLTEPRAVRTVEANDFLWLKVADPVRCFGARTYRADDRLVLQVVESPEEVRRPDSVVGSSVDQGPNVAVGADGAEPTEERPDLVACRAALGPLLIGGATASQLARGRRLAGDATSLERADVMFGTGLLPHCRTPF